MWILKSRELLYSPLFKSDQNPWWNGVPAQNVDKKSTNPQIHKTRSQKSTCTNSGILCVKMCGSHGVSKHCPLAFAGSMWIPHFFCGFLKSPLGHFFILSTKRRGKEEGEEGEKRGERKRGGEGGKKRGRGRREEKVRGEGKPAAGGKIGQKGS